MEPNMAMPIIPVTFIYIDNGTIGKQFQAICSSVPRVGEVVFPQAGSNKVFVHAVAYQTKSLTKEQATMMPVVFLRELTEQEQATLGSIIK